MPTLYVSISAHGFGHGALTMPVLDALHAAVPGLKIVIGTGLPEDWLRSRLTCPFVYRRTEGDIGLMMTSPTDVDITHSAAAYRAYHKALSVRIDEEAKAIAAYAPDLILSNIGYTVIAAGKRLGLPVAALAPFDWSDIVGRYLRDEPGLTEIIDEMRSIYGSLDLFLRPEPSLPPKSEVCRPIGVIATAGTDRTEGLRERIGCDEGERIGLIAFGGIKGGDVIDRWIQVPGWRWIVGENFTSTRSDMVPSADLGMPFTDLLASVDVVVAKPGYGTYTEAACSGARVLTMEREDWPEWPHLARFLTEHCTFTILEAEKFWTQNYAEELGSLAARPRGPRHSPTGPQDAVAALRPYLP